MATQADVAAHLDANPDATLKEIMAGAECSKPTAVEGRKAWREANPEKVVPGNPEAAEGDESLQAAFPPKPAAEPVAKPTEEQIKTAQPKTYLFRLR